MTPVTTLPWLMLPLFAAMAVASFFNDYGYAPVAVTDSESPSFFAKFRRPEVIAFFIFALLMQMQNASAIFGICIFSASPA